MRTTVTLDDDVAALLERLQRAHGTSRKQLVNAALRIGLQHIDESNARKRFSTRVHDGGRLLIHNFDKISAVLALLDDERDAELVAQGLSTKKQS